ncbi:hypothetical protein KQX54_002501 [Cotesia glomerata]|uniref:Uncharacterized protein n=1 Tax=Cotesia glomerata TaxID=32391 RepID=A0AAV7IKU4_COTGL|nr:hypothetical protein KQX54_002501 [Cotesia glomerata]
MHLNVLGVWKELVNENQLHWPGRSGLGCQLRSDNNDHHSDSPWERYEAYSLNRFHHHDHPAMRPLDTLGIATLAALVNLGPIVT